MPAPLWGEVDRKAIDARHVKHRAHFAPVTLCILGMLGRS